MPGSLTPQRTSRFPILGKLSLVVATWLVAGWGPPRDPGPEQPSRDVPHPQSEQIEPARGAAPAESVDTEYEETVDADDGGAWDALPDSENRELAEDEAIPEDQAPASVLNEIDQTASAVQVLAGSPIASVPGPILGNGAGVFNRMARNEIRLSFRTGEPFPSDPPPGAVLLREMLPGGLFGGDLLSEFSVARENGRLFLRDGGATLEHRHWYKLEHDGTAWEGVPAFCFQYVVQVADCDGSGSTNAADLTCINASIPTLPRDMPPRRFRQGRQHGRANQCGGPCRRESLHAVSASRPTERTRGVSVKLARSTPATECHRRRTCA